MIYLKRNVEYLLGFPIMGALAVAAYFIAGAKLGDGFASSFRSLATGIGIIFAVMTLKKMQKANDFQIITDVHSRFNEELSYQARGYLFSSFKKDLEKAVRLTYKRKKAKSEYSSVKWILNNIEQDRKVESTLNRELKKMKTGLGSMSALSAVERVLLDFDLIAAPYCNGDRSAWIAAHAWRPILEKTSEAILPLVAIKTKLRGPESTYKYHYLKLLHDLHINLMGLRIPKKP